MNEGEWLSSIYRKIKWNSSTYKRDLKKKNLKQKVNNVSILYTSNMGHSKSLHLKASLLSGK